MIRRVGSASGVLAYTSRPLPELAGLGLVLVVAAAIRLAFALRPPSFLTPDSQGYFLPGWELAHGLGFGPELRRTPAYPLFVAVVVMLLGEDLRGLTLAQHGLGVATAGLTYALGRLTFGRLAGLFAGLSIALAGPQLIYEHYVLTESLFTCSLTLATCLAIMAWRQPSRGRLILAGLALAAAMLVRPVAEVLVPILPLALLLKARSWRAGALHSAWFGLGLVLLVLPWMTHNAFAYGTFSAEGALGQALIGRTVRHDDYRRFYNCPPSETAEDLRLGALRIICEEAATGEPSGGTVTQRVRDELGLSQAATSSLLRQIALEAIGRRLDYFVSGTLSKAGDILAGKRETVIAAWRERTTRNWDNKWDPRLTPLVKVVPPADGPEFDRADALVSFFQPIRWNRPIGLLLLIGLSAALVVTAWRPALIAAASAGSVILASAALDGDVWRYRYPVDPLLAVLAAGGLQTVWQTLNWINRRRPGLPRSSSPEERPGRRDGLVVEPPTKVIGRVGS